MTTRSTTTLAALLFLAALAGTLAVPVAPDRRTEPTRSAGASTAAAEASPEEVAFAALCADRALDGTELAPEQRLRLLDTLRSHGPAALASFLVKAAARTDSERARLVALECLEACATGRELVALVRLATPEGAAPSSPLRAALHAALLRTLERDERAFQELVPAWRSAGALLRAELLACVGERGDPAGLELLAWVATFESGEYDRTLAETCLPLVPRAPRDEARRHLETLCSLLSSEDSVCVQTISIALARARIEAAVPAWIELLESESRGTRERARRSLEELTGLTLGAGVERWVAWHEAEQRWFEEDAPDVLADLASEDDARVLAAVRELASHRLHRDELAEALAELLGHGTPSVRLCACSALQSLGSPLALPALVRALGDEDEAVARAAWSTLRRMTGLELPLDEALWLEQI